MRKILFEGKEVLVTGDETLLDAIHAAGQWLSFGCRSGNCQTCMLRLVDGKPPALSQVGLAPGLVESGHFLACQSRHPGPLSCVRPEHEELRWNTRVLSTQRITDSILRLRLEVPDGFSYRGGQFVSIWRDSTVGRAYSLVSLPGEDDWLECHVRILADGYMSQWLAGSVSHGDELMLRGPSGDCFYPEGIDDRPLLLVGSGVGMAPLTAVLRDALRSGHRGPIRLYHGARNESDLVFDGFLSGIAAGNPRIQYIPCIGRVADGRTAIEARIEADLPALEGWKVMLCGSPGIVSRLRQHAFLSGASSRDIHFDEFHSRPGSAGSN